MLSPRLNNVRMASFDSDSGSSCDSPTLKLVSTCMNCNFSFRPGSSTTVDFCSKGMYK